MKQTPAKPIRTPRAQSAVCTAENRRGTGDAVKVFCRIRPLRMEMQLTAMRVKNPTTLCLISQDHRQTKNNAPLREIQYKFKHIFDCKAMQRDVFTAVAQPLVENLIQGRDSLLFTYGVTGGGKTYTMTGNLKDRGVLPQCLDVLFCTISDCQAKKFVFKPDRLNGFEILSEEDALLERQKEIDHLRGPKTTFYLPNLIQSSEELSPLDGLNRDNIYSVFITYVEIFNNSVYDLLENSGASKTVQSKIIREDAKRRMFVHGVSEVEVKTMQKAFEIFLMGQKRKHMGHTQLNAESSRSHSVFNIRLVQAPKDNRNQTITISQLSLVDLAGSERTSRTKNTGARLREAGNINNSLMTLRTCLEYLRENQQMDNGMEVPKKIPYRDSKITHLFKSYFEGEGQVSMIVCINPRMEDYDENLQVLRFAEMTQEVQIPQPTPIKTNPVNNLPTTSLGPKLTKYDLIQIQELKSSLELRLANRSKLCDFLHLTTNKLREILSEMDKDNQQKLEEVLIGIDKQKTPRKEKIINHQRSQSSDKRSSVKNYNPATQRDIYATPLKTETNVKYRQQFGNRILPSTFMLSCLNRTKSFIKLKALDQISGEANEDKDADTNPSLIDANELGISPLENKENINSLQCFQSSENLLKDDKKAHVPVTARVALDSYKHSNLNTPKSVIKINPNGSKSAIKSTENYKISEHVQNTPSTKGKVCSTCGRSD